MNILFLYERPIIQYMGGVQRVTHILTQELQNRGHKVIYLSTNHDNRIVNSEKTDSLKNELIVKQYYVVFKNSNDTIAEQYNNILKEEKIDIVINQKPHNDTDYLLSITPKGIKKISCIHLQPFYTQDFAKEIIKYLKINSFKAKLYLNFCRLLPCFYKSKTRRIETMRLKKSLEVSDYLCFLSDKFIPRFLRYMPYGDVKKLTAVNNPIIVCDTNVENITKEKTIIWVGRQSNSQKNIPAFIDIWKIISKNNIDWKAIIIGGGSDIEYNRNYAKRKGVKRLEFVGPQKDVSEFYKKAHFVAMTSTYEGWGMVLTEAMSYGCVPFAYDTYESLHDIIDDSKNGIIVKPFDKKEMARRIQEIIDNKEKFTAMQYAALEKVKTFSVEKIVDKWEEIFKL